ncbi:MAG: 3-hydroxyacyl-ACP dehydratase FabZ family protein [Planctomycetota bacterium]
MTDTAVDTASPVPLGSDNALFDVTGLDLSGTAMDKAAIERWIPHRGDMSLLSRVAWIAEDNSRCVAAKDCRDGEFWVAGHFPHLPVLPGVLMIEAAAQTMCMMYNLRFQALHTGIFTRIEECSFRGSVGVGQSLHLLIEEIRFTRRGFQAKTQGWVAGQRAFDAKLSGVVMTDKFQSG